MDIIERIWEEQELDLLYLQEELNEMKNDWIHETAHAFAVQMVAECEESELGLPVPIIPCEDEPMHTWDRPYCQDESCPCHYDDSLFDERVYQPVQDGLMTFSEANALRWGENV